MPMLLHKVSSFSNGFDKLSCRAFLNLKKSHIFHGGCSALPYAFPNASFSSSKTQSHKAKENLRLSQDHNGRLNAKQIERDFFFSVLNTTATKRDAKAYLSRFNGSTDEAKTLTGKSEIIEESNSIHIALIKLRLPKDATSDLLDGLGRTFSQLARLGLSSVIVLDGGEVPRRIKPEDFRTWREKVMEDADRLVSALHRHPSTAACRLEVLGVLPADANTASSTELKDSVVVQYPEALLVQLRRSVIPVIVSIGYTTETQTMVGIDTADAILSLTRSFTGLDQWAALHVKEVDLSSNHENPTKPKDSLCLDRIIVLDPLGGIPSDECASNAHVFINMEQEYHQIREKLLNIEVAGEDGDELRKTHLKNLDLLQKALTLLPSSSSALLTTPEEAATDASGYRSVEDGPNVGTRRPKNLLIHNLLTDKPLISSSLPRARLNSRDVHGNALAMKSTSSTFVKRGMPLTLIPDPHVHVWQPPLPNQSTIGFNDPRIDFSRLLNLIEDSFNRPLDVEHYINRVQNRIAGVIVAGEYEGGAILTWECPPGVLDDGSAASRARMVPYLDKFAVLKRSQGAGGVADIVFTAMVRDCFPEGVCWRSRKSNPVNKWYFERAVGTWKLPDTDWTMFWTTESLLTGSQRWSDYEAVCRHVPPSWADNKQVVD